MVLCVSLYVGGGSKFSSRTFLLGKTFLRGPRLLSEGSKAYATQLSGLILDELCQLGLNVQAAKRLSGFSGRTVNTCTHGAGSAGGC